ncbi:hypothetical protein [Emticicia sp. BO119]|uniref:hypothetical protein n=1 Tax=Emticicia sp. BO119 TaxID=2757768 RepID=UPI0015F0E94F|nr:hypothetical protein [Emticicia sp. BO119]MBA4848756.1 hypothetical protein [Emticicia sp. BO119]
MEKQCIASLPENNPLIHQQFDSTKNLLKRFENPTQSLKFTGFTQQLQQWTKKE